MLEDEKGHNEMNMHALQSGRYLRRGQRIVVGFYLTLILSAMAWISVWGLRGTTLIENVVGKLSQIDLLLIPLVPSIMCLIFLVMLQGSISNTNIAIRLPKDSELDERQIEIRNAAYQKSYKLVGIVFLCFASYFAVASAYNLPLPLSLAQGLGVFALVFLIVVSTPLALIAWKQ